MHNRQDPKLMAEEAAAMIGRYGFGTLKLKGGQGFETDRRMLRAVRSAVGDDIVLTVDANGAYTLGQAAEYLGILGRGGCGAGRRSRPRSRPTRHSVPCWPRRHYLFSSNSPCITVASTNAFIEAGATALSIKPGRVGVAEAAAIAGICQARGIEVCAGMYAESALGSLISLQFATLRSQWRGRTKLLSIHERAGSHRASGCRTRPYRVAGPRCCCRFLVDWGRLQRLSGAP